MRTKTNHCLDCIKGIGCICVVFIHVKFPGCFGDIVWRLSQFAVPVFFLTSGYFAYSLDKDCTDRMVKRRAKRIFWLSVWTTCFYWLTTRAYSWIRNGCPLGGDANTFLVGVAKFLFLQDVDFSGGGHLWFLWALLWCYVIVLAVNHLSLWRWVYRLVPLLVVLVVIQYACRMYFEWTWHTTNFLPAITYVMTGFSLAAHYDKLRSVPNSQLLAMIVVGELVSLVNLLHPVYDFSEVGIIVASISMFIYAIKNDIFIIEKSIEIIGRKYSLNIYIYHIIVFVIVTKVFKIIGINYLMMVELIKPIIVVLLTLFFAIFCVKVDIRKIIRRM